MSHHHYAYNAYPPVHHAAPFLTHVLPAVHGGGIGGMIMSSIVHFAMWRILSAIFRMLGPWGIAFCIGLLVIVFLFSRRRAY